jgi:hypothetical protein
VNDHKWCNSFQLVTSCCFRDTDYKQFGCMKYELGYGESLLLSKVCLDFIEFNGII